MITINGVPVLEGTDSVYSVKTYSELLASAMFEDAGQMPYPAPTRVLPADASGSYQPWIVHKQGARRAGISGMLSTSAGITAGTIITVMDKSLRTSMRPKQNVLAWCHMTGPGMAVGWLRVGVYTTGSVTLYAANAIPASSYAYVDFGWPI